LQSCLAGLVLALALCGGGKAQQGEPAAAEKAAYLYKFIPFVAWPSPAAEFPGDMFPICIVGNSTAFAELVNSAVSGQTVNGHKVVVRVLANVPPDPACAVLYVGSNPQQGIASLDAVQGRPILTVTDDAPSGAARGIINFVVRGNRVRFEIDEATATADGLTISSKLLSLASDVRATDR
jgi:hypothetical protein